MNLVGDTIQLITGLFEGSPVTMPWLLSDTAGGPPLQSPPRVHGAAVPQWVSSVRGCSVMSLLHELTHF